MVSQYELYKEEPREIGLLTLNKLKTQVGAFKDIGLFMVKSIRHPSIENNQIPWYCNGTESGKVQFLLPLEFQGRYEH